MKELSREQELEIEVISLKGQVEMWEHKYNELLKNSQKQQEEFLAGKKAAFEDIGEEFDGLDLTQM